ncbi:transcriptional regulator with XRE-family HTH domain [Geomicrobium halophilum]|uniref:Transcriptional regulator with XRE-family HTH domain n=1 Tax=Geomicrobium halophilum TaxID=549000 RepID=A0A841PM58_9BACL|nr:helix-turn-helix transcriptional regulator [Geomicrobium halophilum]MBB6449829.1 transcriptional regulator with XRE-family HTH domain [Geomicrobium halophilum]
MNTMPLERRKIAVYGKRLSALRKRKKLSQEKFTDKLGINRSTYSRYENEETQPDYETLEKIADFHKVSVDYILGRTEDPNAQSLPVEGNNEEEKMFFSGGYENLTEEEKEHLEEELQRFRKLKKRWEEMHRTGDGKE